jgi:hypothetical protein
MSFQKSMVFLFFGFFFCGCLSAQESTNYYQKYGFKLPDLKKGQYVLSADWEYYNSEYNLNQYNTLPYIYRDKVREHIFAFNGTIALTDQFLFQSTLILHPSQETDDYDYSYSFSLLPDVDTLVSVDNSYTKRINTVLEPHFLLAYRPNDLLELHFDFRYQDFDYTYDPVVKASGRPKSSSIRTQMISFGLTYHGQL